MKQRTIARTILTVVAVSGLFSSIVWAAEKAKPGPIDLNSASEKQLEDLPGVGKATAKKIVAGRPYATVDELKKAGVPGKTIDKIRSQVTIRALPPGAGDAQRGASARTAPPSRPPPSPNAPAVPVPPPPHPAAAPTAPAATSAPPAMPSQPKVSASASPVKLAPGQKININTASAEQLDALPGIGPVKAKAIIEARPFSSIEDVKKVKGIKEGEFGKIKDLITVQ